MFQVITVPGHFQAHCCMNITIHISLAVNFSILPLRKLILFNNEITWYLVVLQVLNSLNEDLVNNNSNRWHAIHNEEWITCFVNCNINMPDFISSGDIFETPRHEHNGRHCTDGINVIFKNICIDENKSILIHLPLKLIRKGPIDKNKNFKPLLRLMMIQITNAKRCHQASSIHTWK